MVKLPELDLFWAKDIDKPDFDNTEKVHDWRNYVPDIAIDNWDKLSLETRTYIVYMAENQASSEEWE